MREPPPHVSDTDVLAGIRRSWDPGIDRVEHLPVGFGAHHWAAYTDGAPRLFATFDRLEPKRSAARLEAAYAGAWALHDVGLEFVHPPVRTRAGTCTVTLADGALSCTTWVDGVPGGDLDVVWTTEALRRLHSTPPPLGLPPWRPLVDPDFAEAMTRLTEATWGPGPYAQRARQEVHDHLDELARWTVRYHGLAEAAPSRPWVATHGEPDQGNQLLTELGRLLVDWESLKLAPAELDLRTLVDAGQRTDADAEMLELFDLEWRLDEISQYAAWFTAPHAGTKDDEIAFGDLHHELTRPEAPW